MSANPLTHFVGFIGTGKSLRNSRGTGRFAEMAEGLGRLDSRCGCGGLQGGEVGGHGGGMVPTFFWMFTGSRNRENAISTVGYRAEQGSWGFCARSLHRRPGGLQCEHDVVGSGREYRRLLSGMAVQVDIRAETDSGLGVDDDQTDVAEATLSALGKGEL